MAQLKDLIVNGASRFIGDIYGNNATFSGTITGSLDKTFKIKLNNTQYTYDGSANVDLSTIYAPTAGGTTNQILVSAGSTSAPTWKATANGAAYATAANGALTFGTLPIAQGGTGKTSWDINKITYASAANTLDQLAHASSTSYLLKSGSASNAPSWI